MFDHVGITVSNVAQARAFYAAALKPLGMRAIMDFENFTGYGASRPIFWIGQGQAAQPRPHTQICFAAPDRATVDAFYKAALAAGGKDNGAPGLRPHYHANYYGAFVLDADGHNIEAVCHNPA
jgi:catechol 2,3-dioxygenase-like lactoylglutathione lyase family enzyme